PCQLIGLRSFLRISRWSLAYSSAACRAWSVRDGWSFDSSAGGGGCFCRMTMGTNWARSGFKQIWSGSRVASARRRHGFSEANGFRPPYAFSGSSPQDGESLAVETAGGNCQSTKHQKNRETMIIVAIKRRELKLRR